MFLCLIVRGEDEQERDLEGCRDGLISPIEEVVLVLVIGGGEGPEGEEDVREDEQS